MNTTNLKHAQTVISYPLIDKFNKPLSKIVLYLGETCPSCLIKPSAVPRLKIKRPDGTLVINKATKTANKYKGSFRGNLEAEIKELLILCKCTIEAESYLSTAYVSSIRNVAVSVKNSSKNWKGSFSLIITGNIKTIREDTKKVIDFLDNHGVTIIQTCDNHCLPIETSQDLNKVKNYKTKNSKNSSK
jgi:hypothetical protein